MQRVARDKLSVSSPASEGGSFSPLLTIASCSTWPLQIGFRSKLLPKPERHTRFFPGCWRSIWALCWNGSEISARTLLGRQSNISPFGRCHPSLALHPEPGPTGDGKEEEATSWWYPTVWGPPGDVVGLVPAPRTQGRKAVGAAGQPVGQKINTAIIPVLSSHHLAELK